MGTLRYATIISPTFTDGPGMRTSIYFQGCSIRCVGCQSPQLWDHRGGIEVPVASIARAVLATGLPVTILGGEPFDQACGLAQIVATLKGCGRHVIVYSGYTYEQLRVHAQDDPDVGAVLGLADVLVDGPFIQQQDDPFVQYRGSRNQRPIDLVATRETGVLTVLDWDMPELVISDDGSIFGAEGLIALMSDEGQRTRRCGQWRTNSARAH